MKKVKRNFDNLVKVANSIADVKFQSGSFTIDYLSDSLKSVRLFSNLRTGIGSSILNLIPSNFTYRLNFKDSGLYLTIWYE